MPGGGCTHRHQTASFPPNEAKQHTPQEDRNMHACAGPIVLTRTRKRQSLRFSRREDFRARSFYALLWAVGSSGSLPLAHSRNWPRRDAPSLLTVVRLRCPPSVCDIIFPPARPLVPPSFHELCELPRALLALRSHVGYAKRRMRACQASLSPICALFRAFCASKQSSRSLATLGLGKKIEKEHGGAKGGVAHQPTDRAILVPSSFPSCIVQRHDTAILLHPLTSVFFLLIALRSSVRPSSVVRRDNLSLALRRASRSDLSHG